MSSATPYVNISAYKFVTIQDAESLRTLYQQCCAEQKLKGTILLSPEGINLFLAGLRAQIDSFVALLHSDSRFSDIAPKESFSASQPFTKMLVKLKREIITMNMPLIKPEAGRAPAVRCATLNAVDRQRWQH